VEEPIKLNPEAARLILRLCVEALRRANARREKEAAMVSYRSNPKLCVESISLVVR